MCKPPKNQRRRESDIKRGHINGGEYPSSTLAEVADLVSYAGNGKHKRYQAPNREWIPNLKPGNAECDQFAEGEWEKIKDTLSEAIRRGLVQWEQGMRFPARAWAVVNGVLHEARLTNADNGEYHAFPLSYESQYPADPSGLLKKAPNVPIALH